MVDVSETGGESFGSGLDSHERWKIRLEELAKEMQEREQAKLVREKRKREERGMDDNTNAGSSTLESWEENEWTPFRSKLDWDIAKWAIDEGIGKGSIDRLLQIPGVSEPFCAFRVACSLIATSGCRSSRLVLSYCKFFT